MLVKLHLDLVKGKGGLNLWEYFIARLTILITLSLGTLLIVLFPCIKKESIFFARFSLVVGLFVLIVLCYFIITSPVILEQIFKYGFR
jgi:hypothetical protein